MDNFRSKKELREGTIERIRKCGGGRKKIVQEYGNIQVT
jgi:hypothetical protein